MSGVYDEFPERTNPFEVPVITLPDNYFSPERLKGFLKRADIVEPKFSDGDIEIGDRTYSWRTNFGLPDENDRLMGLDEEIPEWRRKHATNKFTSDTNRLYFYQELMRRGFGILPELQAQDIRGEELSKMAGYYEDTQLLGGTWLTLMFAIEEKFPNDESPFSTVTSDPDELTPKEISGFMDDCLQQEHFEYALDHYLEYMNSMRGRGSRQAS